MKTDTCVATTVRAMRPLAAHSVMYTCGEYTQRAASCLAHTDAQCNIKRTSNTVQYCMNMMCVAYDNRCACSYSCACNAPSRCSQCDVYMWRGELRTTRGRSCIAHTDAQCNIKCTSHTVQYCMNMMCATHENRFVCSYNRTCDAPSRCSQCDV